MTPPDTALPSQFHQRAEASALAAALAELGDRFGQAFSVSATVREQHGKGESYHATEPPDAVVFATSTDDVADAVKICARHGVPMIAFGTGTSLEGHVTAPFGGVSIDVSGMNRILRVGAEDLDVTVEAGVTRKQLNQHLRDTGLFFPIDPGADASLGGMTATRASGTNAVRYGTMRENVLALTVVTAEGKIIKTANRARKSSAGYDLTRLFVGSEGTLGIITEVTLRLYGIPEAISAAVCPFPTLANAVNTVIQTIQAGVPVARMELLDEVQIDAVNRYSKLSNAVQPTLFFEFHGSAAAVAEHAEMVREIAAGEGATDFHWTASPEERARLWEARHNVLYACLALKPGARAWATDVCVPISRLADCILETKQDLDGSFLLAPIVGHAGDGNFHLSLLIDPDKPEDLAEAKRINSRLVQRALAMDGTCTGEHGVGSGKIDYLPAEHGEALEVMRSIKRALDPRGLMNPGKILRM